MYMKNVPFFANTPDDTHCVQASFRIILKYFLPERDFSYDQLDKMSRYRLGKSTWWPPMLLELQKLDLEVKVSRDLTTRSSIKRVKAMSKTFIGAKRLITI